MDGHGYDHIPLYISVKFSRDKILKICFLNDLRDTVRIASTVKLYINLEDGVGGTLGSFEESRFKVADTLIKKIAHLK